MRRPFIAGNLHAFDASTVSNYLKLSRIFGRHCTTIHVFVEFWRAFCSLIGMLLCIAVNIQLCVFVVWRLFAGSPQQTEPVEMRREKKKSHCPLLVFFARKSDILSLNMNFVMVNLARTLSMPIEINKTLSIFGVFIFFFFIIRNQNPIPKIILFNFSHSHCLSLSLIT